jgi:F-type H+-transporting ATPase subunit b
MDATGWATLWAFVALIVFLGLLLYMKVPGQIGAALDKRAANIATELEEARRLREEAQALLAEYQRKREAAVHEAEDIISNARAEAVRLAEEAEASLASLIERRTRAVETKIGQAESQALAEVRTIAADVSIAAATRILSEKVKGPVAADLMARSIGEVKARLN